MAPTGTPPTIPLGPPGTPRPLLALTAGDVSEGGLPSAFVPVDELEELELLLEVLTGPDIPEKKLETLLDPIWMLAALCDAVTSEVLLVIVQFTFIP
ncbi:MAG: hypothetical protein ACLQAT_12845 [Candidatus Binataceae bacterium]